ncbi:MAG TPA: alkaline phosphatase family protein [Solirubrobacteraceae bacterium]
MRLRLLATTLAGLLVLAVTGCGGGGRTHTHRTPKPTSTTPAVGIHKIQHIVIIMQENRSFDSYFGTYPGADGLPMQGGVPAVCVPDPITGACVRPYHDRHDQNLGGPHSERNSIADVNGGHMNGFIAQERGAVGNCTIQFNPACAGARGTPDVMGYHTGADIPNYWAYAHKFVLQDHMFESTASWSLPSHLFMVSEWSAYCTRHADPTSCRNALQRPAAPPDFLRYRFLQPGQPDYAWTDLTYLLHKYGVSWRYYVFQGSEPDCQSSGSISCAPVRQRARTPGIWNPLPYFDTVRQDQQLGNVTSLSDFYAAAQAGTLPAVSWINPNGRVSEHPPALISTGQTYVTGLINAIMRGPNWNSTAIFVSWDDWGGFFDHVRPPVVDQNGYGLRVPGLLISPYARTGMIDHQTLSFDAYAKFIEDVFLGGQRLDPSTDGRPDPRPNVREKAPQLGDLASEFNFSQSPLAPVLLPAQPPTDLIAPATSAARRFSPAMARRRTLALVAVAGYLGVTPARLRTELASGVSLSQLARQHGVTLSELQGALRGVVRGRVEQLLR